MQKPQLLYFCMGFSSIWHVYVLTISGHFCGGVPALWMNFAEIVFAVAQPLGKTVNRIIWRNQVGHILKLCEIIVFIIYVSGISV